MRVGIVIPHIFMQDTLLPQVIFSPGQLGLALADDLVAKGIEVTLYTPGIVTTKARNKTADLRYFKEELAGRGDTYIDLLKKHPLTFITLARQAQSELLAGAIHDANNGELDILHIYTNEEDLALPFAQFCQKPIVFTHHDPFNFLVNYKHVFPKYKHLNWLSIAISQRAGMPKETNWIGNIYHGVDSDAFKLNLKPRGDYFAYFGRIIYSKGVHWAIQAVKAYNQQHPDDQKTLRIAGKHYSGNADTYWTEQVEPHLGKEIIYEGYLKTVEQKQEFLGNAAALLVPSVFEEPFGMVMIEALACGTPVVGFDSGALPEVIEQGKTGYVVKKEDVAGLGKALNQALQLSRQACRQEFDERFTLDRMTQAHIAVYQKLQDN